jgi:hypothetical protein
MYWEIKVLGVLEEGKRERAGVKFRMLVGVYLLMPMVVGLELGMPLVISLCFGRPVFTGIAEE